MSRDQALAEFALRYFRGHGPATIDDYAWWSGLTLTDCRKGVDSLGDRLESAEAGSRTHWMVPALGTPRDSSASAHLLWGFDEYIVGYKYRGDVFSERGVARAAALGGGMMRPVAVVNGKVVGNWRRKVSKSRVTVEVEYFERTAARDRRAIADAAESFGRFLQLPVELLVQGSG